MERPKRSRKTPERLGVVTGRDYKKEVRYALRSGEKSIVNKFNNLSSDVQNELLNAPDDEFELTLVDLDHVTELIFPEVPFQASPTGMTDNEKELLRRIRGLELPLGAPPLSVTTDLLEDSRMSRNRGEEMELDERRLNLLDFALFGDDSDSEDGDEFQLLPN